MRENLQMCRPTLAALMIGIAVIVMLYVPFELTRSIMTADVPGPDAGQEFASEFKVAWPFSVGVLIFGSLIMRYAKTITRGVLVPGFIFSFICFLNIHISYLIIQGSLLLGSIELMIIILVLTSSVWFLLMRKLSTKYKFGLLSKAGDRRIGIAAFIVPQVLIIYGTLLNFEWFFGPFHTW